MECSLQPLRQGMCKSVIRTTVWTIGHSRHEFEPFASLLSDQNIEVVADVRTFPSSKMAPDFNEPILKNKLLEVGVDYVFLGLELGGRPNDSAMYDDQGRVLYGPLASSKLFKDGLAKLTELAQTKRVVMLCSEGKPDGCHRHLLLSKVLDQNGLEVIHILPDGSLTSYTEIKPDNKQPTLFEFGDEEEWKSVLSVRPDLAQRNFS
jgi:uncharacterized protein (DUF488 family)